MRLILGTTFLLWRPPKICILHGGKIEHYLLFQNLTSTCHGPTAENHIKSMVTPHYFFLLVQKNLYSQSPLCTRSLTPVLAEIWFFKSLDRGSRTKGPLPNLGRLTVISYWRTLFVAAVLTLPCPLLYSTCLIFHKPLESVSSYNPPYSHSLTAC